MKSSLLLLGVAVLLALVVFVSDPGRASRFAAAASPAADTAAGAMPAAATAAQAEAAVGQLVLQRCGGCHSLDTLQKHPQDAAGWTQTIADMRQLGAQVAPDEEPAIVAYLAQHFGKQQ